MSSPEEGPNLSPTNYDQINGSSEDEVNGEYMGTNATSTSGYDILDQPDITQHDDQLTKASDSDCASTDDHSKVVRENEQSLVGKKKHLKKSSLYSLGNFNKFTKDYIVPYAKWAYYPMTNSKYKYKNLEEEPYKIEYSAFKRIPGMFHIENEDDFTAFRRRVCIMELKGKVYPDSHVIPNEFEAYVDLVIDSIELHNIYPSRISKGSSGSYFVAIRDANNDDSTKRIGVFKPKDEEPYGPLSPKWTKWLHRTFFPCFFGRAALIPNLGYVSEAAASTLDRKLLSFIVPYTDVVYLKSPTFYYSFWDRRKDLSKLPKKIGSLQKFLDGYTESTTWFRLFPVPTDTEDLPANSDIVVKVNEENLDSKFRWSSYAMQQFREELEKLVILDYIMRNTDRSSDNWMIKVEWRELDRNDTHKTLSPHIKIGAIDSGLAFPWKRPDGWRSFPYGWLFLPLSLIGQPFSNKTRNHYLPLLTSSYWWETTVTELKHVFQRDNDFKERMWNKQLAVIKGQAYILTEILKLSHAGPLELTRREDNILIWDDVMFAPRLINNNVMLNAMESSIYDLPHSTDHSPHANVEQRRACDSERTPLLERNSQKKAKEPELHEPGNISGFEYNLNFEDSGKSVNNNDSRRLIIERVEKSKSKPPVFTWC